MVVAGTIGWLIFYLAIAEVASHLHPLAVQDLPGVSYHLAAQLEEAFSVKTVADLLQVPRVRAVVFVYVCSVNVRQSGLFAVRCEGWYCSCVLACCADMDIGNLSQ